MVRTRTAALVCFVGYLFRFMQLFEINRFKILEISEQTIKAKIGWPDDDTPDYNEDEETQEIEWDIQEYSNIEDALKVAEFLIDNRFLSGDKISIDQNELFQRIGWEKDRYDAALKTLLSIRVEMADEGKRTDHFFVHF